MIENPEEIQLRSEEVQEILGTPPNWLIRWGTVIALIVVIGLIIVSWMVRYPDIIPSKITITTPNLPVNIVTRSNGFIAELLIEDESKVQEGTVLAIMENTADYESVQTLKIALESLQKNPQNILSFQPDRKWQLGGLQPTLSRIVQLQQDYFRTVTNRFDLVKIRQLNKQIKQVSALNEALQNQQKVMIQELALQKKDYDRSRQLFDEKVIAAKQFETDEALYLQKKRSLEALETSIINNQIQITNLEAQIADIQQNTFEDNASKLVQISEEVSQLLSEIESWQQQFVLISPISGIVSLTALTEERQYLSAGKEVATIIPSEKNTIVGNVKLPIAGSGKVEKGQRVNIKLDGFPYREYGIVLGEVQSMSAIPREGLYDVTVHLPNKLVTTYNKDLGFQQQMQGVAEIVTKDRRLIERIFDRILSAIYNQ